uniref:Uncharacterized protein n=1 Tax=Avena sativa TaxID=4498 RepID=A0ACD5ZKB0_AVESA
MADQEWKFEAPEPDPAVVAGIKQVFHGQPNIQTEGQVRNLKIKIKDFDGQELELSECFYKLGLVEAPRLLKRVKSAVPNFVSNYDFISKFHHPTAVQVDNYYLHTESLVVSRVNGTFTKWLAQMNNNDLFTAEGTTLPLIREMIIDLSTLVESLIAKGRVPVDLGLKDLYIKILPDGTPKLQVLLIEVSKVSSTAHMEGAWANVRKIVKDCFESRGFHPNNPTTSFCNYIGIPPKNIGRLLEDFPDQWDNSRKGIFLLESCANAGQVSFKINRSGLVWPVRSDGLGYPQLLLELISHCEQKAEYNENFPYDYVKLCRDSYKHFKKIRHWLKIKLGGNRDGLLRQFEEWSPNLWSTLYTTLNGPNCK